MLNRARRFRARWLDGQSHTRHRAALTPLVVRGVLVGCGLLLVLLST